MRLISIAVAQMLWLANTASAGLISYDESVHGDLTDNILEGITRRTAIELARNELGLTVIERPIDRTEVYLSEEFFMTGTAAQIVAVTQVDHRLIGSGMMGPITSNLRELYSKAVRGRLPDYQDWNFAVYSSEQIAAAQ